MKITVMVRTCPYQHQASDSAWHFVRAAIMEGHTILSVFFYQAGVYNANNISTPPQDERNVVQRWVQLAEKHNLKLLLCSGSALHYGVLTTSEAQQHGLYGGNLAEQFESSSLLQFVNHSIAADHVITFLEG